MPSAITSTETIGTVLNHTPEFTELAARHGPFFFGVFLVLVAVVLVLLNKNRYITSLFAVCGILFMVSASLIYSGIGSPIHAYTMRIDNLTENDLLVLTDSPPRLYRHNRVHDLERDSYHVDLATISPNKLEKGHSFKIIIKEAQTLKRPDGTQTVSYIKHRVSVPFKGEPYSIYALERIENDEEEGLGGYKIVEKQTTDTQAPALAFFQNNFIPEANAGEVAQPFFLQESLVIRLAQSESITSPSVSQSFVAEESSTGNVEVIYFKRPADREKVTSALSNVGITYGIIQSRITNPINAVWVGVDVPSQVAKSIGESLLEEGVELRYFGYFTYRDTKTNVVQIGYSKTNAKEKPVSQGNIELFSDGLKTQQANAQMQQKKEKLINQIYQQRVLEQQLKQQ